MGVQVFSNCEKIESVYLNWDYAQVEEIYNFSHGVYKDHFLNFALWGTIFTYLPTPQSKLKNKTTKTNIFLPIDASTDLINLYKKTFDSVVEDEEKERIIGMGLDPNLTHFIGSQQKENKIDYGLILAVTFGSISLIWLGGLTVYFNRKIKKFKSTKKSK